MKDNDYDFDGALDEYVEVICDGGVLVSGFIEAEDYQAIKFALALAKEMQVVIKDMGDDWQEVNHAYYLAKITSDFEKKLRKI